MKEKVNFDLEYEKIVGGRTDFDDYLGPEEQAQRITPCSILEVTEIGYDNSINIEF